MSVQRYIESIKNIQPELINNISSSFNNVWLQFLKSYTWSFDQEQLKSDVSNLYAGRSSMEESHAIKPLVNTFNEYAEDLEMFDQHYFIHLFSYLIVVQRLISWT